MAPRRSLRRTALAAGAALGLAIASLSCGGDGPTSPPAPKAARLTMAPSVPQGAAGGPAFAITSLRAVLSAAGTAGALAESTVVSAAYAGAGTTLQADVAITEPSRVYAVKLAAIDASGDTVFRGVGTAPAYVVEPGVTHAPKAMTLTYARADAAVTAVQVMPRDTTVSAGDTLRLRVAVTAGGTAAPAVGWTSRDETGATVSRAGTLTAAQLQKTVWVIATTFTGVRDSTRVTIAGAVASVAASADSVSVARGDSVPLGATLRDQGGTVLTGRAVAWSSTDAAAAVSASGVVKGLVANGTALVVVTSNGRSDTVKVVVAPRPVASITTGADTVRLLVGETAQLSATALDAQGAANADFPLAWTTADAAVASVTAAGMLTGAAEGAATVTASAGGTSRGVVVLVSRVPARAVEITTAPVAVAYGDSVQLAAVAKDSAGAALPNRAIIFTSLDPARATVDAATGVLRATFADGPAADSVAVVAATEGVADTLTVALVPVPVAGVAVTPPSATTTVGGSLTLAASVSDARGRALTGRPVAWTSLTPAVASVSAAGVVTALAVGTAQVEARHASGAADTATITVGSPVLTTITVALPSPQLARAYDMVAQASAQDEHGAPISLGPVTWSSTDPTTATIDAAGRVHGIRVGTVRIRATSGGVVGSALLSVVHACAVTGGTSVGNSITTSTTWQRSASPYRLSGSLAVTGGAVLTIEAGTTVCVNSGQTIGVSGGARLVARGTPTLPITFSPSFLFSTWGGLTLSGAAADSSYVTNTIFEQAAGNVAVDNGHSAAFDSVTVRQMAFATLRGAHVRLSRSTIDTVPTGTAGLLLSSPTLVESVVVRRTAGIGIYIFGAGAVLDNVSVLEPQTLGIHVQVGHPVLKGVVIDGAGSYGILTESSIDSASTPIRIRNGKSYPILMDPWSFTAAYATREDQDYLLGNARDTLRFLPGAFAAPTTYRRDLPWVINGPTAIRARLDIDPGARLEFSAGGRFGFYGGGYVVARGTPAQPITFTAKDPTSPWEGLRFEDTPGDTSVITNAVIEYAGGTTALRAVRTTATHPVVIDSTVIRQSKFGAVTLLAPGSRVSRSAIDTTTDASMDALELGDRVTLESTTIRGSARSGVLVSGANARIRDCRITTSAQHGVVAAATASGATVHGCALEANAGDGVANLGAGAVDATGNWWGDAAGPLGPNGDGASGTVLFTPWLTTPPIIP